MRLPTTPVWLRWMTCTAAVALGACLPAAITHQAGGDADSGTTPNPVADGGLVDPDAIVVDDLPLPRLAYAEYQSTVTDLVTAAAPTFATSVLPVIQPIAARLLPDELIAAPNQKHGGFSRLDQTVQQAYAEQTFSVAMQTGIQLTSSPTRVSALLGSCYTTGDTAIAPACLQTFIQRFGALAFRRPPSSDDLAFYATAASTGLAPATALTQVIALMMSSPRFLYHVESGDQAVPSSGPNVFALDAWELASRLSYHFWGTMPDAALRDAAGSGALLTASGFAEQLARIVADPRTDATFRTFFLQWLWPLIELPPLNAKNATPVFAAFAGSSLPSATLTAQMVTEVLDAASWTIAQGGSFAQLLENGQSFAKNGELAAIYGVPVWDGTSTPPVFPSTRTGGLLSHAAFLSSGSANTRPIMKGVFIRTGLLCDTLPPPPAAAAAATVTLSPTSSTRQVVEQLTEQDPGCAGCHKTLINPLGFASENFDALGRMRTAQALFDNTTGAALGTAPIDTTSIPQVTSGDMTASTGLGDLRGLIEASGKADACFAARYFRYTFRRLEDPTLDAKILADITAQSRSGAKLSDLLANVATRPEFKQRLITP